MDDSLGGVRHSSYKSNHNGGEVQSISGPHGYRHSCGDDRGHDHDHGNDQVTIQKAILELAGQA